MISPILNLTEARALVDRGDDHVVERFVDLADAADAAREVGTIAARDDQGADPGAGPPEADGVDPGPGQEPTASAGHGSPAPAGSPPGGGPGQSPLPGVRDGDPYRSGAILPRERVLREAARAMAYEVVNVERRTREIVIEVMGQLGERFPLYEGDFDDAYSACLADVLQAAAEHYREQVRRRLDMEAASTRREVPGDWQYAGVEPEG